MSFILWMNRKGKKEKNEIRHSIRHLMVKIVLISYYRSKCLPTTVWFPTVLKMPQNTVIFLFYDDDIYNSGTHTDQDFYI